MRNGTKSDSPRLSSAKAELASAVKRSDSGQLSVSIDDVSKTPSFQRDLKTLARIRKLSEANSQR